MEQNAKARGAELSVLHLCASAFNPSSILEINYLLLLAILQKISMSYTNEEFGRLLNQELARGYDIVRISRWAYEFFFNNIREINAIQRDVLQELFRMEDDPQFEYSEQELRLIAEKLINGENNPIKQINDMMSN